MLWFTKDLCSYFTYTINGGKLGRVHTFYFDSRTWTIYNVAIDEDFLVNIQTWGIDAMIVDTRNWLPGKKVMVTLQWVDLIASNEAKVYVNLPCNVIKNSPKVNLTALAT